jgi:hypothetical protein
VINASWQVLARNVIVEVERVEEFVLIAAQLPHHLEALPSTDVLQDSQQFTCLPTSSAQSAEPRPTTESRCVAI